MCVCVFREDIRVCLRVSVSTARLNFVRLFAAVVVVLMFFVQECLQAFFSAERLRGSNRYHCEGCDSKKEAGMYRGGGEVETINSNLGLF